MSNYEAPTSDAAILDQIRALAESLSDQKTRDMLKNVTGAVALNPQPLPPEMLRTVLEAVALNPQPLPPEPPER